MQKKTNLGTQCNSTKLIHISPQVMECKKNQLRYTIYV